MNPHVVGDGDDSGEQGPPEFASESFREAETVLMPAAGAGPDPEPPPGHPYEPISAEAPTIGVPTPSANLPVRYGSGASTEVARTGPAAEPGWEEAAADAPADGRDRTGSVVVGDLLLTVNAADGSSAEPCPSGRRPQPLPVPGDATARPRATGGHLLERDALCDRLRDRLSQGRCVRVTGQGGSGRTAVLDTVAAACAGLAPAGVVQLSGYRRTTADLLQDLFAATYDAPGYRPGRERWAELLRGVGAVVVIDDLEFGGDTLEELLGAAPECAFLVSSAPDVPAPLVGSRMEEVTIPGLSRQASLALLARLAGRSLDETERAWAVDLWFESEGLPLRFVQAGALLRHREAAIEALAAGLPGPDWDSPGTAEQGVELLHTQRLSGTLVDPAAERRPTPGGFDAYLSQHESVGEPPPDPVPLPSVAESAAPAVRIARGLSRPARRTLELAVALGGECPTAPHLPALVDVGHGEAALEELVEAGLAVVVGVHHRLVDGVCALLADEWPDGGAAREAGQHFAWWTGHASVTEEQIAAEAEVLLAAMHADRDAGRHAQVVLLARAAAPSFALALRWGAWERALRFGQESARSTGAVAAEAWFHHELGVLGLCTGAYDRARAELEASVAMRAALGDARGAIAGRRVLSLLERSTRALTGGPAQPFAAAPRPGLRRLAGRAEGDRAVNGRQLLLAVAGVVLMGALGSGIALGVGAFQHSAKSAGVPVAPVTTPTVPPLMTPSTSATASGSATPSTSPSTVPGGPLIQPGVPGTTPSTPGTTPGTTPSTPATTPSRTQSSPTHPVSPPPAPPASSSASASSSPSASSTPSSSSSASTPSPSASTSPPAGAAGDSSSP
ncbi:ATP-binding protein [Streptacidiphilus sp. P02-A3a]|uniref:ATP-binding protein n=1 Tax=Streptacidiphilus sp. P02-A3a TaxID=2704468 RepID=UPI0015F9ED8E|nr:ATP-binding protein [Streptacidiphilus sp. P02-A3a]QMU72515.1 ATP-binding protein [Streptacidiphilus sp. P02-A3a]